MYTYGYMCIYIYIYIYICSHVHIIYSYVHITYNVYTSYIPGPTPSTPTQHWRYYMAPCHAGNVSLCLFD